MFQERSLDFKLVKRICLLQQALDQALESLEQLQQQVAEHQVLEAQLAQTEEYANVQQQIISALQQQLTDRHTWQQQGLQHLLANAQALMEQQQPILERLRFCIGQSQSGVQDYLLRLTYATANPPPLDASELELTSEVMIVRALTVSLSRQLQIAQQQIGELDALLTRNQISCAYVRAYLEEASQADGQPQTPPLATPLPSNQFAALQTQLQSQTDRLKALEQELSQQFQQQTQLKYRCQRLAAERDHYRQQLERSRQENQTLQAQLRCQQPNLVADGD